VIVARTVADVRAALAGRRDGRIGLVPTMGALHGGHEALLAAARDECDAVVMSLFVNPAQFGEPADLNGYPRDEAGDLDRARAAGVDVAFAPSAAELYPPGYQTWVDVTELGAILEGEHRHGHFRGVATVCLKLFNIVRPARAYFGQKDAQQVMVIRQMARDLAIGTEVVTCPTVREADGLALSSRNVHLSPEQRAAAGILRRALVTARDAWDSGERSADALRSGMRDVLATEPLADVEYVSVADGVTLEELETVDRPALASMAVSFGDTRLIDNEILDTDSEPDPGTEVRPQVYGG